MKYIFILFIIAFNVKAQNIKGVVLNIKTNAPIEYANILILNTKGGTYTNKLGVFELKLKESDSLKISAIGYKPKLVKNIDKENIKIKLEELEYEMNEIVISSKKIKYTKNEKLGLKNKGHIRSSKLIGMNVTTLIENPEKIKGKLGKINLYLNKTNKKTSWKAPVFIAKLNIHFYEFDSIKNIPGKELYNKNLIVKVKNKKYIHTINVEELNIKVPKNGICIGVEFIDHQNNFVKYNHVGPALRYTNISNKKLTWTSYRNKDWRNGAEFFMGKMENLMMSIEVLFPKQ